MRIIFYNLILCLFPLNAIASLLIKTVDPSLNKNILAAIANLPRTGTIKRSGDHYYYAAVDNRFIKRSTAILQNYLANQHISCFHSPHDLRGQAHISLSYQGSPNFSSYLNQVIHFSVDKVFIVITRFHSHHHTEKHIWYAIQVQSPELNKILATTKSHVQYTHISFAVAKYQDGLCHS